jgi:hypothetical protein
MFAVYGQQATAERIALYADTVGEHFAVPVLLDGIRDAMREAGDFPPGPGTVRRCVLAAAKMRPGDPVQLPEPRDNTPRLGPGAQPTGALFSRMERRVERSYQRVIERAKEIVAERKLPITLDSRLWSLGEAERELNFIESSPCRCSTPCSRKQLDVSLERVRHAAGVRCGAIPRESVAA